MDRVVVLKSIDDKPFDEWEVVNDEPDLFKLDCCYEITVESHH